MNIYDFNLIKYYYQHSDRLNFKNKIYTLALQPCGLTGMVGG